MPNANNNGADQAAQYLRRLISTIIIRFLDYVIAIRYIQSPSKVCNKQAS